MLISVIIPSYNHKAFIKAAVDSVLAQTYSPVELIVIDDGSTDGSDEVLRRYVDQRVQWVEQENKGAHAAINRGLELARGDYIAVLNSDDVYHPQRLEKAVQRLEKAKADFVCSWIEIIDGAGKVVGAKKGPLNALPSWLKIGPGATFKDTGSFRLNLLMSNFVSTTSNMVFKRTVYEKIGGMRPLRFSHDWDFALRAAATANCTIIEEPLLQYRLHGSNTITQDKKKMLLETCLVLAANIDKFEIGRLYFESARTTDDARLLTALGNSLVPVGTDRLFWMLLLYFRDRRRTGQTSPEDLIFSQPQLQDALIAHIE